MGFFSVADQNLPSFCFIKDMLLLVFSNLPLMGKSHVRLQDSADSSEECPRPSPLLVPVPAHCLTESMKERLQVVEYNRLLERSGGRRDGDDLQCAVCLDGVGEKQEVRELGNCCHVFHKECIDSWMDKGHGSCPLCRSKLSPAHQGKELKSTVGDPWRMERMIYLFGEDYVMGSECED